MSADQHSPYLLNNDDGIVCLEGLIFMKEALIKKNDDIVKQTFEDLYKHVCPN